MAENVNERLEEMVPELVDLEKKNILNQAEIKKIIQKRRSFEYRLISSPAVHDYLKYIEYETALDHLRRRRKHDLGWKKRTLSDRAGANRIFTIFERAVAGKYKGDIKLWFQYIDFCLESGSTKQLERVLLRALRIHPTEERLWILAADRQLKQFHFKAARTMLIRALRFIPKSLRLWQQYFKLECLLGNFAQMHPGKKASDSDKDAKTEAELPDAPVESASSTDLPATDSAKSPSGASLDVLCLLLRRGCAQLGIVDSCDFLAFAHGALMDYANAANADHVESWRKVAQDVAQIVDGMLESPEPCVWSLWWTRVGPRHVQDQLQIVLNKASDANLVSWMLACQDLASVADELAGHERIRRNPNAVAALPLTTEATRECLHAAVAENPSNFSLLSRLWSIKKPNPDEMLAACRSSNFDALSASTLLRVLPSEYRLKAFLQIAFRLDASVCRALTRQLLAFELAQGVEAYRSSITRLTDELPKSPKAMKHEPQLLAIFDAILVTDAQLSSPGLESLFDKVCAMEKDPSRLVELWIRYESYVEGQGKDAGKIRWRANRVIPEQALVECKLRTEGF